MNPIEENRKIKIAGIADLHVGHESFPSIPELGYAFETISSHVDVIAVCGDFTQNGSEQEAQKVAEILSPLKVPIIGVLGNHDYIAGKGQEVTGILNRAGVTMLEGQTYTIVPHGQKVTFTGSVGYWEFGKPKTGINAEYFRGKRTAELKKVKDGLNQLNGGTNIVLLHFPPIKKTALSPDRLPHHPNGFSDLEFHLDCARKIVKFAMHGHSHHGSPEGTTNEKIRVYNVAIPVNLGMNGTNESPSKLFRVFEV